MLVKAHSILRPSSAQVWHDLAEVQNEFDRIFRWNFGDGSFSNEQSPTHTYAASERSQEIGGNGEGRINRIRRPYPAQGNPIPHERWRASNPIIVNGRVVLSAFDSESVQCLDLRTGKMLWSDARRPEAETDES